MDIQNTIYLKRQQTMTAFSGHDFKFEIQSPFRIIKKNSIFFIIESLDKMEQFSLSHEQVKQNFS